MFEGNLADFEELVLSVRDRNSREYIGEAVADYRSRCFRSAISATWVAVTYDIISKIRELSLQGDANARVFVGRVDNAIALRVTSPGESKKQLQAIEGELLTVAHRDFELLTDHDLREMERLREDRHLCAHPAFAGEDYLFQPSPELTRMHIVHATVNLLQHPPIQGKAALQQIKNDLLRDSFPSTQSAISEFMDERYLKHIRVGLIDNLITVFLKDIIKQAQPALIGKEEAVIMCLVAVQRRYGQRFADRMRQELPRLSDGCGDDELCRVMRLFRADRRCWGWLGKPSQIRITEIVRGYTFEVTNLDSVASCLEVDELRPLFAARAAEFTHTQKHTLYSRNAHPIFVEDAIKQYEGAQDFRGAEALFEEMIRPFMNVFTAEQIKAVLAVASSKSQIYSARDTRLQMVDLFERTMDLLADTSPAWQSFLTQVSEHYDHDGRFYSNLRDRMISAGISP
jgi:hypothetical protein